MPVIHWRLNMYELAVDMSAWIILALAFMFAMKVSSGFRRFIARRNRPATHMLHLLNTPRDRVTGK